MTEPIVQAGPYKFLDHFTDSQSDQRRFAGRDTEAREITALTASRRTVVLYGRSGVGKTSLLLAGVFPALRARGYLPLYVRTLADPLADLRRTLAEAVPAPPGAGLRELAVAANGPLMVALDQFEELLIRFRQRPELQIAFLTEVAGLVHDPGLAVSFLFSLREDYLAALENFKEQLPELLDDRYRLSALSAFGIRQAITRPLLDGGVGYEEAVVSRLVDQLEGPGVETPTVQIACSELYREAARRSGGGEVRITVADLEAVGGMRGILHRYLDGLLRTVPAADHLLARIILDALTSHEGTRRAATLEELPVGRFVAAPAAVEGVLEALRRQRLVRGENRGGVLWYELVHEHLVPHLRDWLERDREFFEFRQARDFVHRSSGNDVWRRRPEALLNPGVLSDLLARYRGLFRFDDGDLEFIVRSAAYRRNREAMEFWAQRFGAVCTAEIVCALLDSPHELERAGGAAAAGSLVALDGASRLAEVCLERALLDPSPAVRREAGRSLARLAGPPQVARLNAALRRGGRRRRAVQVLASLHAAGDPLAAFPRGLRRLARWLAERRVLHDARHRTWERSQTGAVSGSVAGLLHAGTIGLGLAFVWEGLTGAPASLAAWVGGALSLCALAVPVAAFSGFLAGRLAAHLAARHAVLHGEGRWAAAAVRGLPALVVLLAVAGVVSVVATFSLFLAALALLGGTFVGALLARVHRPALWPSLPLSQVWAWSLVAAAGLPLLAPFVLLAAPLALFPALAAIVPAPRIILSACAVASLGTCVAASALARSSSQYPFGELPSNPWPVRRRRRALAAVAAGLVPLAFCLVPGPDVLPAFAATAPFDVAQGLDHVWRPGRVLPDLHYFWIDNGTGRWQLARTAAVTAPWYWRGDQRPESGAPLLLPPGRMLARFELGLGGAPTEKRLVLSPAGDLEMREGGEIAVSPGEPVLRLLELTATEASDEVRPWAGTIRVRAAAPGGLRLRVWVLHPPGGLFAADTEQATLTHATMEPAPVVGPPLDALARVADRAWVAATDAKGRWEGRIEVPHLPWLGTRPDRLQLLLEIVASPAEGPGG